MRRATLDCPRCGQRIVDLDVDNYVRAGNEPDDFADMLARLTNAHQDTCAPARSRPSRRNVVRRRLWWGATAGLGALYATSTIGSALEGNTSGALGFGCALVCLACWRMGEMDQFRHGYFRGRHEERRGRWPSVRDLHPADRLDYLEEKSQ